MNKNYCFKNQDLNYNIEYIVKDIDDNESKILLKIGFYKWVNYHVGMLSHEDKLEKASDVIATVCYNIKNNGFKEQKSRYLKKIITTLIKASGNNKQKYGFRRTIDKIVSKIGEEKLLESIKSNNLIIYGKVYEKVPTKYKEINKTIKKLERRILNRYT